MTREPVHNSAMTEADTCREFITPKLVQAGWSDAPFAIGEQRTFMRGHEVEVMRLLGEIEALVNEVQT